MIYKDVHGSLCSCKIIELEVHLIGLVDVALFTSQPHGWVGLNVVILFYSFMIQNVLSQLPKSLRSHGHISWKARRCELFT